MVCAGSSADDQGTAGYYRGAIDLVIARACDIVLSFPVIILYMIILAHFGSSALHIIGVLTLTKAPIIARIVRGLTIELREREYVAAAKMRGESPLYIMRTIQMVFQNPTRSPD